MAATTHRFFAPRPGRWPLVDGAIAIALFLGTMTLISHDSPARTGLGEELDLVGFLLLACSTLPLAIWRRFPLGVFTVTAAAGVLLAGLGYRFDLMVGPAVALYLLAGSRGPQTPWTTRTTATVTGILVAYLGVAAAAQATLSGIGLVHSALPWAVAWFAGERTRLRLAQIGELQERAVRAERDLERERLLAAAEERTRIARDLHDSAGHAINVIAVRAGAARIRHKEDPDRSLRALEAIEMVARNTVEEIDHMVGTLRDGGSGNGEVEAPASLASVQTLIKHHTATGLAVRMHTSGDPRPLGPAVDQAAYRILQEALTNAARYGTGSARVDLSFDDTAVEVTVGNRVSARRPPSTTGGHGLIGMRERTTLLGGVFDAGTAKGRFRVRARIPYGHHPS